MIKSETTTVWRLFGIRASSLILHPSLYLDCPLISQAIVIQHCNRGDLRETFASVRGYGLRAYEPRQGRNAATVV